MRFPTDIIVHCETNKKGTAVKLTGQSELIRCKDCKWYEMSEGETYCRELGIFDTDPTSYCSYAKRAKE